MNNNKWDRPIEENQITFAIPHFYNNTWMLRRLIKIRELDFSRVVALCCLSITCTETDGKFLAFDASGSIGLAAIQWVKHFPDTVNILINTAKDSRDHVIECLKENSCSLENVEVVAENSHALMHQRKCKFLYIEVCGSVVMYLDAAMQCINHKGIICVTCTDIEILMNRCPETAERLYGGKLLKTEYSREMGVRVIIANMVRAAGRWNKGIQVEMCCVTEQGITIVCRILKGPKHSGENFRNIHSLAHCQSCQNRQFVPEFRYISSMPSSLTSCTICKNETNVPILLLGPMWSGSIFNTSFLLDMYYQALKLKINAKCLSAIEVLIKESSCFSSCPDAKSFNDKMHSLDKDLSNNKGKEDIETTASNNIIVEPSKKRAKIENANSKAKLQNHNASFQNGGFKMAELKWELAPTFFFDIQHHSVKGGDPPRVGVVVERLRMQGHRASRTHFSLRGVKTSSSLEEFIKLLNDLWSETTLSKKAS